MATGDPMLEGISPGRVPSGLIGMWHGLIADIPSGFVICDGNNSTPNLLAKFIEGVATAGTNPGATGGAVNKTTAGHSHTATPSFSTGRQQGGAINVVQNDLSIGVSTNADSISDIRPPYYDVAFIMKT